MSKYLSYYMNGFNHKGLCTGDNLCKAAYDTGMTNNTVMRICTEGTDLEAEIIVLEWIDVLRVICTNLDLSHVVPFQKIFYDSVFFDTILELGLIKPRVEIREIHFKAINQFNKYFNYILDNR